MRKAICVGLAIALAGCAAPQATTKNFNAQLMAVHRNCLSPLMTMTGEQRFTVDPATHRAPITGYASCYSNGLLTVANAMQYAHLDMVYAYLGYQERIVAALNEGKISSAAARTGFVQAGKSFDQAVAVGDIQLTAQARRDFANNLAALGAVIAEADRQRAATDAANRPIMCTATGIYAQNTIICQQR